MFPKTIQSKAGDTITLREAEANDAPRAIEYTRKIIGETDFLTRGEGEFEITEDKEREIIAEYGRAANKLFLIAEIEGKVVGLLTFSGGQRPRTEHTGDFGVSVSREYWQAGIGNALMDAMIEWAKEGGIVRKIDLRVRTDNETAIRLYEKFGFEREGTLKREMRIGYQFHDEYQMGLCID